MSTAEKLQAEHAPLAIIVEDDPTFETSMTRAVAQLGAHWRYASFRTASEALHFIDRADTRIDLALVDIGLPDISGIEVISPIRSRFPEIPIMVVSVISAERSVLAAIRAGARGYVLKDDSTTIIAEAAAMPRRPWRWASRSRRCRPTSATSTANSMSTRRSRPSPRRRIAA